jgi:RNA polymerase sigma-B factor
MSHNASRLSPDVTHEETAMAAEQRFTQRGAQHPGSAVFRRYRETRDRHLRDELVTRHLPLARSVARRFDTSRVASDDLLQVASIGLIKAVDRYDPSHGTTFATFAVPTIRGEILRYFRDYTWGVRPPRELQERALQLAQATDVMRGETGRVPSAAELAERVGSTVEDVLEGLYAAQARDGKPIEPPPDDDERAPRRAALGTVDSGYNRVDDDLTAQSLMIHLTAIEQQVVHLRFRRDLTQAEVGTLLGCSQMQVSRVQRSAITKLTRAAAGVG